MSLRPFRVSVGFWWIGVVCSGGFTYSVWDQSLKEFGFHEHQEYNQYYPGYLCNSNESQNLMAYAEAYYKASKSTYLNHMLYDADQIQFSKTRPSIKSGRFVLRELYLEPYDNDDPTNLFIFPEVDDIREAFCYTYAEIRSDSIEFWFCTDWKG